MGREYYVESVYQFHGGVKFVHETKIKHDMDKISLKDGNFTLLYVRLAYMKHVNYAHRFPG